MSGQTSQTVTRADATPYTRFPPPTEHNELYLQSTGDGLVNGSAFNVTPSTNEQPCESMRQLLTQSVRGNSTSTSGCGQTDGAGSEPPLAKYNAKITEQDIQINLLKEQLSELQIQATELKKQLTQKNQQLHEQKLLMNSIIGQINQQLGQSSAVDSSAIGSLPQPTPSAPVRPRRTYEAVFGTDSSGKLMQRPDTADLLHYKFRKKDDTRVVVNISAALAPEWDNLARLCNVDEDTIRIFKKNSDKDSRRIMSVIDHLRSFGMNYAVSRKVPFTWKTLFEKIEALDAVRENEKVQELAAHMGVIFMPVEDS